MVASARVSSCTVAMGVQAIGFTINWQVVKSARVSLLGVTVSHADTRSYRRDLCCIIEGSSVCHATGTLRAWCIAGVNHNGTD